MLETLPLPEADDLRIAPPSSKLDVSSLPPPSVTPCPVMAAAEASLEAPAAAEEEDFRRKQLAVRSEEKEAQQAAREEAKNKKKQQKPQAKAKGRPRKTDSEAAPKKAPKRKKTEETEVPAVSAPVEANPKKQRRTAAKSKAKPAQWEYPPEVDRDMIPEFLEVMKEFKDQSYDKSEMTLHTKYLD